MKRLYLCGPINGCTDAECVDWREYVKTQLADRYVFVDPMARDFRGIEGDHTADIVEGDKADIANCDVIIANAPKPSVGTSMEVLLAWNLELPVLLVHPADAPVSPWMRYHVAVIVHTMAEAVAYLESHQ